MEKHILLVCGEQRVDVEDPSAHGQRDLPYRRIWLVNSSQSLLLWPRLPFLLRQDAFVTGTRLLLGHRISVDLCGAIWLKVLRVGQSLLRVLVLLAAFSPSLLVEFPLPFRRLRLLHVSTISSLSKRV